MNVPNMKGNARPRKRIVDLKRPRRAGDLKSFQSRFAHEKFLWLKRVAGDADLPRAAYRLAIWLSDMFNLDHQGTAWPSHETLAKELGITRRSVVDAIGALVEHEHLASERRGQHRSNRYRMASRCEEFFTSEPSDVKSGVSRCEEPFTQNPISNPEQVEVDLFLAQQRGDAEVKTNNPPPVPVDRFPELRVVWDRPWDEDDTADREAFVEACRKTSADTIIAGARDWAAATEPRYLKPLWKWLNNHGWEKPPPKRKKRGAVKNGGKVDLTRLMLKQEAGWTEDAEGNLTDPETGRTWEAMR